MILGYSRASSGLPVLSSLKLRLDFSDLTTLYKTFTSAANPCYSSQASSDGDSIASVRSIIPVATSDWALQDNADSTKNPLVRISSPGLAKQCLDFDGSNDRLGLFDRVGTTAISPNNFFAAGAKTCLISFRCESLPASGGTYQPLFADSSGSFWWGIYVYNNSGTVQILFQNHDTGYVSLFHGTVAANTNYVVCVRHDSGTLYASLNNDTETSLASGNTSNMTSGVLVAGGSDASVFNGRIGEIIAYNTALSGSDLSTAIAYMINKWV